MRTLATIAVTMSAALIGCATSRPRPLVGQAFTEEAVATVRVGQSPKDIRRRFGEPDVTYAMQCGQKTDVAWEGVALEYVLDGDPRFAYINRCLRNRFVFALVNSDTVLNHWKLEETLSEAMLKTETVEDEQEEAQSWRRWRR